MGEGNGLAKEWIVLKKQDVLEFEKKFHARLDLHSESIGDLKTNQERQADALEKIATNTATLTTLPETLSKILDAVSGKVVPTKLFLVIMALIVAAMGVNIGNEFLHNLAK